MQRAPTNGTTTGGPRGARRGGTMTTILRLLVSAALLVPAVAAEAQTILGNRFEVKEKTGYPQTRRVAIKAQESLSPENLVGDPVANGAVVQVIVNGGTPSTQTIVLPGGPRWRVSTKVVDPMFGAVGKWQYRESLIFNG